MQLAHRLALVTAVLSFGAATAACKKEAKKADEPTAKTGDGSGSAATSDAVPAAAKADPAPVAPAAALSGFKGAMAKASSDIGLGGKLGLGGGATGGLGGALGGIFGGGAGAGAGAGAPTDEAIADDQPAAATAPEVKLPPGKAGGDCAAVTDRLMVVVRAFAEAELASLSPDERKLADSMIASELDKVRGEVLAMCTSENWSQALRDCVLTAPDMAALEGCDQFMPADSAIDGEPTGGDDEPAEPVATPAPAWTGGDDCAAVGKRLMALALHGMGEIPAEVRAELEAELGKSAGEVATMCTDGGWTVEVRQCVVKSTTMSDAEGCLAALATP